MNVTRVKLFGNFLSQFVWSLHQKWDLSYHKFFKNVTPIIRNREPSHWLDSSNDWSLAELTCYYQRRAFDWMWTESGLWRILLMFDWIRTVNCFINYGSGPDFDWGKGNELRSFCHYSCILLILLDFDFKFLELFGLWLVLDWVLKIQDWIAKYDSPLISGYYRNLWRHPKKPYVS